MSKQLSDWEKRCADLLERVMATAVVGGDPKPLQEELKKLMAEKPQQKKDRKNAGTEG
jgi:hypothetical protein